MIPPRAQEHLYHTGVVVLVAALFGVIASAWIWPVVDEVETGKTETYPELSPRYFSADAARVVDEGAGVFATLASFERVVSISEIEQAGQSGRRLRGRVKGWWTPFDAELEVRIVAVTPFVTEVSVRSTTPSSPGDLGQNARNIEAFYEELERRIGALRFIPKTTARELD
jgi:hypothetical protein